MPHLLSGVHATRGGHRAMNLYHLTEPLDHLLCEPESEPVSSQLVDGASRCSLAPTMRNPQWEGLSAARHLRNHLKSTKKQNKQRRRRSKGFKRLSEALPSAWQSAISPSPEAPRELCGLHWAPLPSAHPVAAALSDLLRCLQAHRALVGQVHVKRQLAPHLPEEMRLFTFGSIEKALKEACQRLAKGLRRLHNSLGHLKCLVLRGTKGVVLAVDSGVVFGPQAAWGPEVRDTRLHGDAGARKRRHGA